MSHNCIKWWHVETSSPLITRFMGPTWGPSGANMTQVGPILAPWSLLSGPLSKLTVIQSSDASIDNHASLCWWEKYTMHPQTSPYHASMVNNWAILKAWCFNSLAPGKFEWHYRYVIFQGILVIDSWGVSCEIALIWMSVHWWSVNIFLGHGLVPSGNKSLPKPILTQICEPYGITGPQWVNVRLSVGAVQSIHWCISSCLYVKYSSE